MFSVLKQGLGSDVNESDLVPLRKQERRQVLQLPRIAIHHGMWRELMFSIPKSSTELNCIIFLSSLVPLYHLNDTMEMIQWNQRRKQTIS